MEFEGQNLSILNPNPVFLPGPSLLHHLVQSPCDALALEYLSNNQRTSLSYQKLHDAADVLAARISLARGQIKGQFVVPVLIHQSPCLYTALLAILKAGGAFCPLNVDAPPERVNFILKDVATTVVVASEELAPLIPPQSDVKILLVDKQDNSPDLESVKHRIPEPNDLAYVMYTSGSTGTPKGVGISHSAATQSLLAHDIHVPEFSRFLQFASPTFDVSVFEIFFPLIRGRTLISVNRKEMLNDLPAALSEMQVDACELTPTVAASLLRSRENAPALKLLLTIGEMLNVSVVQEFGGDDERESLLWAMYGPTEAAIHCTLQGGFLANFSTNNIGIPLDTVSCFVIEPASSPETSGDFKLLPMGEVGELAIGGYQLADGYLNRPEQTAAAFISSPYGRVYRTGDKARMKNDGTLECLGRMSEGQVKLRGQRIELGEVQAAVLRTPGCHGAVPAVIDSILVVFCSVDGGVTEESILSHCSGWLPQFMVPGELVLMEEFPRLPSGKVDTRRLKTEFQEQKATANQDDDEPLSLSETEVAILHVLSEVLDAEVNHRMTLASAGVDSLVAIKLASALRASGFEASAVEILNLKTIADLCSTVQPRSVRGSDESETVNLSLLADLDQLSASHFGLQQALDFVEDVLPCSPLQIAMLAETAQQPDAYWNEVELESAPDVTAKEISEAIHQLAFQNEILRSGFVQHHGGFVSPVFKALRSEQVQIVDAFHELDISGADELLSPIRIQIQDGGSTNGTRILFHIHHAIYDGWSMDIMLSDLAGLLSGTQLPSRQQFRNFIKYSNYLPRNHSDNVRTFWSEYLLGWNKAPVPKLNARPAEVNRILTRKNSLDISPEVVESAAQKNGYSPQVFFQTALTLVWGSILGSSDVLIGSVTSGRTLPVDGIEEILGPCIASMPLRVNMENTVTILDVLTNVKSSNRSIMEHCSLSLSEIRGLTGLRAAESLYDILFVYQESLYAKNPNRTFFKELRHLDRLETKLLIEAEPQDHGFKLQATYHSGSFTSEIVDQLLQQVIGMFTHILSHSEESIQSARDVIQAEPSIDNPAPEKPQVLDLAGLFEATVARNPETDAICFGTSLATTPFTATTMSYETLNRLSNQTANFLLDQGTKFGEVVAIIMEKSPTLYASILGIVKARCAYLPLLPSTPIARVQEIFKSAGIQRCLVNKESLSTFQGINDVQFLDVESSSLESFSDQNPEIPIDMSRLSYVIYTSGTTGIPKGVAVSQRNIVSNVTYLASIYPAAQSNAPRLLQSCSQAFDVSVFEIFYTWHTGMCLCAASNDDLFEDLEHAIRQFRITHLSMTPTVASLIDPTKVPDVEFLVTAGEPMTAPVLNKWGELLWQGYGPSEMTNICTVKKMKRGEYTEHLGWTFSNSPVFVLAPGSLQVVPIGWVGELCFGGDQVADGYLNMPKLTSEKFIKHPEYGRIYRSGDLGRMLPDKSLIILGRIDDQIKLRGQRIEAGEVNAIITSTTLANTAVTTLVRREEGTPDQLASFYAHSSIDERFQTLDVDAETHRLLLANLQSRLPAYMIPSYLIPVSHIPLISSGKVDRRYLQSCFQSLSHGYLESASSTAVIQDNADWTKTELALAGVIAKSLNISGSEIDRWTPFATLGLDSVTAIGVARDLSSYLSSRVAISSILQNPTVAQLSRFIDETPRRGESKGVAKFFTESFIEDVRKSFQQEERTVAQVLPCSPLQEAMLSFAQGSYYNKILLRIHIQPEEMRRCWDEMTKRHGILRTCFVTTTDVKFPIAQVLLENWGIPWKSFDVSEPSLDEAIQEHLKLLPDPLDTKIPPLSLAIIRYKGSAFLSFICHHALYDGVAMENLWREVEALANGKELQPSVSYEPFIQEMLNLPNDTEQFWVDHFRGFSPFNLFAQPARRQVDQCLHTISLDIPYGDIQDRNRSLGVSFLSLCQAAWANTLAVSCNSTDVCFGSVVSGRTLGIEGLDRLVAPCFNTIPIRKNLMISPQVIDLIKTFQRLNSELLRYQFTPLRQAQRVAGSQGRKLFDTLLLLQKPLQEMDANIWTLEEDSGDMDIPLVCEVVPCPNLNSVVVNMYYDMGIVGEDIAAALADIFKNFIRLMLENPSASLPDRTCLQPAVLPLLDTLTARRQKAKVTSQTHSKDEKWTNAEVRIQQILSELSRVPVNKIYRNTSIFHLGLDSINAVQVASMLRRQGFTVSASDVVECQTCAKLADRMVETPTNTPSPQYDLGKFIGEISSQVRNKLPHVQDVEAILPCTPMQCAMLASFSQSKGLNYLNMVSYALGETVSKGSVVAAWKSLRSRHPMLRTGFVDIQHPDSVFAMIRHPAASGILEAANISQKLEESFDVSRWKRDEAASILNTPHLPPWRVAFALEGSGIVMHLLIHHALYDAQSLDAIFADLSLSLGTQSTTNFPSVEPGLKAILTESLAGQNEAQKFWEEKAGMAVVNSFPIMTPLREQERVILAHETTSSLSLSFIQAATQKQGISIQAVIQAAWTRVLSSYLGEDSVVFGVTLSGRTMDETKDAPFPCMTTIPIVTSNRSSNAELINTMMQYNASVHKFQFTPLSQVQKWLGHPATPVFDTLLVYQKVGKDQGIARPWNLVSEDSAVDYPVSLEVVPIEDKIQLCITFFNDVLAAEQAELMVQQFDAIMAHIVTEPDGHEDGIYQVKPQLFSITPAASPVVPAPVEYLHQFVEEKAISQPDAIALEFVSGFDGEVPIKQTWTYAELDTISNRVANMLADIAAVGSIVAIHFDKCPEAYFSILGILKAGCAFVALDPSAPQTRKAFIMSDSKAPCLLTSSGSTIDFDVAADIIRVDLEALQQHSSKKRNLGSEFNPEATCYCLYTSGTTGTPKGCEITHDNCVQCMMAFQNLMLGQTSADARWLQFASLHFDVSVLEQYWSWSVGITMVAAPKDLVLDDLVATINRLEITHIDLTPSLARLITPEDVPTLCKGILITGGEQLKQEILDVWGPKGVIYNAYGPTEATIGVTTYRSVPINGRPSNIGKQFLNVGSYIFRQGTEIPVLRGAVGELCVSGKLVGKGYLNRPELTTERFPTLQEFGERIYRTGDLVRVLHDGCFDFLGRADDQVKLRGQRLEIGEINHVIRTGAPEVKNVATIVVRHGSNGKDVLVSFLVGQQKMSKGNLTLLHDTDDLGVKARAACRAKLPGYMVPTYFLILPYIPLSSNNKVEGKELKQLFNSLSHEQLMALTALKPASRPIDSKVSQKIIDILAGFSGVNEEHINEGTSIFDLGVDSITALQLSTAFKIQGFAQCSPTILLRNPIVIDLTLALSKRSISAFNGSLVLETKQTIQACHHRHRGFVCRALNVQPKDIEYIAPCSPLQQGIISKSMTDAVRGTYFNSFHFELVENISTDRVQRSWNDLVASQAILRTSFVKTSDGYVQVALRDRNVRWHKHLADSNKDVDTSLERMRQDWVQQNNDHIVSPIEFILITTPRVRKLVVHIFHALYDGNSFDLMIRDVTAMYHDKQVSVAPSFLEALSHGPLWRHEDCRQFWTTHLQGWNASPPLQLSVPAIERAVSATRLIDGTALENIRKRHNVTLQSVVMALWTSVLQQYTPNGTTIGLISSGRSINLINVEKTIGPLFNTIPFFTKSLHGHTWASLIRHCHEFSTSVLAFQHVPLKSVQKWCSGGRPLFDNLFVFELGHDVSTDESALWKIEDGTPNPDYPLAFEAKRQSDGSLRIVLVAQGKVVNATKLEEILNQVEGAISSMVTDTPLRGSADQNLQEESLKEESISVNSPTTNADAYEWTEQATTIREIIAVIADTTAEDITAQKTILELGLDSIDVIKLSTKLRLRGINLPASQIMRQQTIAQMVREMETQRPIPSEDRPSQSLLRDLEQQLWAYVEQTGLNMENVESVLPPTPLQDSMIAGMVHSNFEWYFNHNVLEIAAGADVGKLREAWIQVINQSPILRTGFFEVADRQLEVGYCQVTFKRWTSVIEEVQVTSLTEVQKLMEGAKQKARDKQATQDLFQLKFVVCGDRSFVLMSIAHALYDGWSLDLMFRNIEAVYNGQLAPQKSAKPFLERILSSSTDDARQFWADYLEGVSPTILPERYEPAPLSAIYRNEAASKITIFEISNFCRKQGISLQVLCQACWAVVLAHRTRALDVTFGVIMSGRDREGTEDLMFPTMNTFALRSILHGTASAFLKYLEAIMTDIREYQAYPLRKVQAAIQTSGLQLFNTIFMLQKSPSGTSVNPVLKSIDGTSAVDYPVAVEAEAVENSLIWRIASQSKYNTEEETRELLNNLDRTLEFMMRSTTSDILSFQEQGVAVCGLPLVSIEDDAESADANTAQDSGVDIEEWNETALAIRRTLSYVSDIPEESIQSEISLYHLGLDSISAIKVASLLRKEGISLNPRDLIRATSIFQMASFATLPSQDHSQEQSEASSIWTPASGVDIDTILANANISGEDVEAILPTLPMQVYMISAWQNSEGSVFFPEFRYTIDGMIEMKRIHAAWQLLVAQTPILRTRFLATNSAEQPFLQVIVKSEVDKNVPQPFVHFNVTKDEDDQFTVALKIHHALYDGISLPVIMEQLSNILAGGHTEINQDIQRWSKHTIQSSLEESRQARRAFWIDYLRDCPESSTDEPAWTDKTRVSYLRRDALSDVTQLRSIASQRGISMQALFFAAYARTLAVDQEGKVIFGIYLANRAGDEQLSSTYPTLNLVPLRVDMAASDNLVNIAEKIQSDLHQISSDGNADVGLWEIAAWTGVQVTSFVNFLSLPNDPSRPLTASSGGIRLIPTPFEDSVPEMVSDSEREIEVSHPWVKNNEVRDTFPVALDVEASIIGQSLNVGVFGSRQCVSEDGAVGLVDKIVSSLNDVNAKI